MEKIKDMLAGAGGNIVTAILVAVIGFFVIKYIMKLLKNLKSFEKLDQTTTRFILNGIKWLLYVMLIIAVIGILGVPMAWISATQASRKPQVPIRVMAVGRAASPQPRIVAANTSPNRKKI